MADNENMRTMPQRESPHDEHRATFCHPATGLSVEVIATGPSGCGKSLVLDAVTKLLTRDFESRVLCPEAYALYERRS